MLKEEFTEWANNGGIRSQDPGYISHAIDVLEWWLDSKLPNADVGNLFRYETLAEFEEKLKQIKNDVDFYEVNRKDQTGRPQAALNKYTEFLKGRNYIPVIHKHNEVIRNMKDTEYYKDLLVENKNIILHGAPGTGKTHLAKKIAEAMGCTENEIGFVQFHPSYDYTDFVEGIRPNNTGSFDRINGIFKDFCADAIENINKYKNFKKNSDKKEVDVQELFSQYCTYIEKQIKESENKLFPFSNTMNIRKIIRNKQGIPVSIELATSLETSSKQNLSSNIFYRDYIDFKNKKIKSYQDVKPTYESKLKFHGNADYYFTLYQLVREFEDSNHFDKSNPFFDDVEEIKPKNFVFIIDEINRGELSKIFGELFFSIDPGYRGIDDNGKPKGLVKTQYQNLVDEDDIFAEGFYIPENVYIIGTMNDIDRSVESMDFAMRRRFIFEEVTAEDSAENMNLSSEAKERMKRINDVIANTEGLNDAYKVGGAYFLNVDDFDKLWRIKLSSLIKEYLRGIDDDGSKYQKIEDAYFNRNTNNSSLNDTDDNNPTVKQ